MLALLSFRTTDFVEKLIYLKENLREKSKVKQNLVGMRIFL